MKDRKKPILSELTQILCDLLSLLSKYFQIFSVGSYNAVRICNKMQVVYQNYGQLADGPTRRHQLADV